MGTSHQSLLEQQKITSREIQRRKEYFDFTELHVASLVEQLPLITEYVDEIVDRFYAHILRFDEIDRLIGDAETLKKLRNHQRMYILTLFQGNYDEEYVQSRLRIGLVHKRIGVEPRFYVSAMQNLGEVLKHFLIQDRNQQTDEIATALTSVDKILNFDLSLVFDTYIHSLMDEVRRSKQELEEYAESLEQVVSDRTKRLKQQARTDGLTGLMNQTYFYHELRREVLRGQRRGHSTALLYCDLDGFKNLNDSLGHRMGDQVLKDAAAALRQSTRADELVARYGGDEFCVILPEGGVEEARQLADRLLIIMKEQVQRYGISCSVGIAASSPQQFLDADELVKRADRAMYQAKQREGFAIIIDQDLDTSST